MKVRIENLSEKVKDIVEEVRNFGDDAVVKYIRIFDGIKDFSIKDIRLEIKNKPKLNDRDFINAINLAIKNVSQYHIEEYKNLKKYWVKKYSGLQAGQKFVPINSVGVYIPGGKYGFNYISTLIMTIIPAKVANVKNIVVVTPPKNVTNYFLYTLYLLGIREVYRVGGVQAVAALAFGTKTIPKVDLVVGPGNIWVTEAKRQLFGIIGIDLLAGPSEVVVVADKYTPYKQVAFELLAQAEHDKEAKSYLIGLDEEILSKVKECIEKENSELLAQIKFIFERDIRKVCDLINQISPEHLTLLTEKQSFILKNVYNAGAIFFGKGASAVFGDYIAGPSHVLPTNTAARFSSGLSVLNFLKKISIVKFSKNAVKNLSSLTSKLAEVEGMFWHKKRAEEVGYEL